MEQPAKPATPDVAVTWLVVQVSKAPLVPVPILMDNPIEADEAAIAWPWASSTVTCGCDAQAVPAAPPPGWAVKASCAGPEMKKSVLTLVKWSVASVAVML